MIPSQLNTKMITIYISFFASNLPEDFNLMIHNRQIISGKGFICAGPECDTVA
jgi:hypothetical protein